MSVGFSILSLRRNGGTFPCFPTLFHTFFGPLSSQRPRFAWATPLLGSSLRKCMFSIFLYISIVLYICVRCIDSKHPLLLLMRWFSNTLSIVNSLVTYPGHRPKLVNRLNLGNNSVNMQKTTEIDRKLQGNSTLVNPKWYKVAIMSCKRGEIFPINVRNWMGFSGAKKLNSKILWSYYNP